METAEKSHAGPTQHGGVYGHGVGAGAHLLFVPGGQAGQPLGFPVGRVYICGGCAWGWQPAEVG